MTNIFIISILGQGTAQPVSVCEDVCRDTLSGNAEPVITLCIAGCEGGGSGMEGSGMHDEFCEDMCEVTYPDGEEFRILRDLCRAGCTGVLGDGDLPFDDDVDDLLDSGMGSGMNCDSYCEITFSSNPELQELCKTGCTVGSGDLPLDSGMGLECDASCELAFANDPTLRDMCLSGCSTGSGDPGMGSGMNSGDDYMDSGMGDNNGYNDSGMGSGGYGSGSDPTTPEPTQTPTQVPSSSPTEEVTAVPTAEPTQTPTQVPSSSPTEEVTAVPTAEPTAEVTMAAPTLHPTSEPSNEPTNSPTNPPTFTPKEGFKKLRKIIVKFKNALTVKECEDMAPRVCVDGFKLPANRCRYVRPENRRRIDDNTLVTDAEYEADLLSQEEVDVAENQTEEEFLEDFNESLEAGQEAIDADGRLEDVGSEEPAGSNGGAIAAGVIGSVAAVILTAGLVYKCRAAKASTVELANNNIEEFVSPKRTSDATHGRKNSGSRSWVDEDEEEGQQTTAGATGENFVQSPRAANFVQSPRGENFV